MPAVALCAGEAALVPVEYRAEGADVAALQFDLKYDRSLFTVTATIGDAASAAAKTIAMTTSSAGTLRVVIFGLNQDPVPDGTLVALNIAAIGDFTRSRLALLNTAGSSPAGDALPVSARSRRVICDRVSLAPSRR